MRTIHEDEMNDYLDQTAEERYEKRRLRNRLNPWDIAYVEPVEEEEAHACSDCCGSPVTTRFDWITKVDFRVRFTCDQCNATCDIA